MYAKAREGGGTGLVLLRIESTRIVISFPFLGDRTFGQLSILPPLTERNKIHTPRGGMRKGDMPVAATVLSRRY